MGAIANSNWVEALLAIIYMAQVLGAIGLIWLARKNRLRPSAFLIGFIVPTVGLVLFFLILTFDIEPFARVSEFRLGMFRILQISDGLMLALYLLNGYLNRFQHWIIAWILTTLQR